MARNTLQGRTPLPVALKDASATTTMFSCCASAGSGASGSSADAESAIEGLSGTVDGSVCANAVIADTSNPVVSNRRIKEGPSRLISIVAEGELIPFFEVNVFQSIGDELGNDEAECGTTDGAAEGLGYLAKGSVFCRVVGDRKGGAGGVACQ